MKNLFINRKKRIGQVIYVVEGDNFEASVLRHIYCNLLDYDVITYDKRCNQCIYLVGKNDKYSRVYIIPAKDSAIKKLKDSGEYLESVYSLLTELYGLDVDDSALYFIFDRDRKSNRTGAVEKAIERYTNAREGSGYDRNGLLLLSFPSLEAVLLNCVNDDTKFDSGRSIKEYVDKKGITVDDIQYEGLLQGINAAIDYIERLSGTTFREELLDNFKDTNKAVFDKQEMSFRKNELYDTVSMILMSLVDLGIVSIVENID